MDRYAYWIYKNNIKKGIATMTITANPKSGYIGSLKKTFKIKAAELKDIVELMIELFQFIAEFDDEVPGASAKDCGNYLDMNLPMANYWGKRYFELLKNADESRFVYPE